MRLILLFLAVSTMGFAGCECGCSCNEGCDCGCGPGVSCECSSGCECGCSCNEGCDCGCGPDIACECSSGCECGCACNEGCDCGCGPGVSCECSSGGESEKIVGSCSLNYDCGCEGSACGPGCNCCPIVCIPNCWQDEYCTPPVVAKAPSACCWYRYIEYMPDRPPLFRPIVADPREVDYSAGWRFNDDVIAKNTVDVSYGDQFGLVRWFGVGPWGGEMQFSVEGALWAVFDPCDYSAPLVNADYYIGFPLTYRCGPWSFRLRGYHISSHLGDEFLLNNPGFDRRNPSAEYLDLYTSYNLRKGIRLYGGLGWIVQRDPSFELGHFYAEAGTEIRLFSLGFFSRCHQIVGVPFYAMNFRFNDHFNTHINQTYVLGYEFRKLHATCKRIRLFMEYHTGYSVEGQFQKYQTDYFGLRLSYGY